MIEDGQLALFLMLGQAADKAVAAMPDVRPTETLLIGASYDLSLLMPTSVRSALAAAEGYKLFFVFESYLRDFVLEVLSKDSPGDWWARVPKDVQDEIVGTNRRGEAMDGARFEEPIRVDDISAAAARDRALLERRF